MFSNLFSDADFTKHGKQNLMLQCNRNSLPPLESMAAALTDLGGGL